LRRRGGEKSASELPWGCSHLLELDVVENENAPSSTVSGLSVSKNEGSNPKPEQRKKKSSILLIVLCVVAFTIKGFYPFSIMLPGVPHTRNPSVMSRLYEQVSGMSFKPFNTFDMYTSAGFPVYEQVINLVLKQNNTSKRRRVKFIPHRSSDFYLYSNILKRIHQSNKEDTIITLQNKQDISRCNVFACIAKQFILSDSVGTLRESKVDSPADIESIEIVEEGWYRKPTGAAANGDIGHGFVQSIGYNSPFERQMFTLCALDIASNSKDHSVSSSYDSYQDGSCENILTELDAKAMSYDAPKGKRNPFYILPVLSRTEKYLYFDEDQVDAPTWIVLIVTVIVGYKTYLLAR